MSTANRARPSLREECLKPVDLPGRGCTFPDHQEQALKQGRRANAGREGTPDATVVPDLSAVLPADEPESSLIDQIVREGARRMLAAALQAEVDAYIEQFSGQRDEYGHRLVVRNGSARDRGPC